MVTIEQASGSRVKIFRRAQGVCRVRIKNKMLQVLLAWIWFLCLGTVKSEANDQKWDRLLVGFPKFSKMPLNELDAEAAGWIKDGCCDEQNDYVGNRYLKDNDTSTRLIFGIDGTIAGIQTTITPTKIYPGQSSSSPWIRVNKDEAIATAYFRNPATICNKINSCEAKPTFGHELYIQTKSWLTKEGKKMIKIPTSGLKNTAWVKGRCFKNMGMHYWFNISQNLKCEEIFPIFLLFDDASEKLKSFGWAVPIKINSTMWEHPPQKYFGFFFKKLTDIPRCLMDNHISTQHVYLTDPAKLTCVKRL
ncbi:uncharacterized protein LOC114520304 isoform X2 [Dendronephthya gigantea]|uniref:uncharacterized protein LOC114520304 isoform X2 n=1 Tax=Dendronephthya gigantea TaxID=151771 RepID=UPI001069F80E|nr:uncharacterized protein LOC114520304 isoform X2 [Dendronephthya gigantea]